MSSQSSRAQLIGRRAELMAELFLQEFEPLFISRPTTPYVGYDLLVGFRNHKAGVNTFAVEVKSTEQDPALASHSPERSLIAWPIRIFRGCYWSSMSNKISCTTLGFNPT